MDIWGIEEVDVKRHWMLAFLIAGALVISTVAQDVNTQSTNTVVTQQQGSTGSPVADWYRHDRNTQPGAARRSAVAALSSRASIRGDILILWGLPFSLHGDTGNLSH